MTQALTYRYRLLPSRKQHEALSAILEDQRLLYNAALQERIEAYRKAGVSRSYQDQCLAVTECRRDLPEMAALPLNIQRGTLKRLDEAFKFEFAEFSGIRFDGSRLRFKGLPSGLRIHLHRPMPEGEILTAKFKRVGKAWAVCLVVRVETPERRVVSTAVGIDVGIKTLAATSDGLLIANPRAARRAEREMRRRQRQIARCKRGSNRRRKIKARMAQLHAKITNTRATALHQISAMLVKQYDLIAVEALNTKGLARGMLARDVHDAGWAKLRNFLRYKAERAGAHFVEVDPKFTSQDCPQCGRRESKTLAERVHSCACGCVLDRDVAAARVILSRAVVGPGALNVAGCSKRAPGNLTSTETLPGGAG